MKTWCIMMCEENCEKSENECCKFWSETKDECPECHRDVSEDSTKLEPIAVYYSFGAGKENGAVTMRKEVGHADYREPLFTSEQFFELMERHRERACYCDGGDGVNEPECHFCAFVRNLREEFTQNGDME